MKENLSEQISVDLLAKKINLTEKTFTRRFKTLVHILDRLEDIFGRIISIS